MRVTPEMTTESGSLLSTMADFIDDEGTGLQVVVHDGGLVKLIVGSTEYPNKSGWLEPDDADALADLLKMRAREARGVR